MLQRGKRIHFPEYDNQNFFQLASIQSASLGLSVIIIGKQLATSYGAGTAICSIAVGNLILWLIAIVIISMVDKVQINAIENIENYIGRYGGILIAIILMTSFLSWYALQINSSMSDLNDLFHWTTIWRSDAIIRIGAVLGLFTALLSIGGIRLIKWMTVISLPLLFTYHFFSSILSGTTATLKNTWGLSLPAIIATVLILLPGVINYPTFFRHSRSRAHSYLSLTLITVFVTLLEISTIWIDFSKFSTLTTLFILVILTNCNLVNIYFASAAWESIVPRFGGPKGFAVIGLLGTTLYTFLQISSPVQFFGDITNSYFACLGAVLILAFLIRIIVKHRPRPYEKIINMAAWLFGCLIATIYETEHFLQGVPALLAGVNASILLFIVVIFIEETMWAFEKKFGKIRFNK